MQIGKASACKICGAEARLNVRFENRATLWWVECCGPMRHRTEDFKNMISTTEDWNRIATDAMLMEARDEAE